MMPGSGWSDRKPGQVVDEMQSFARRKPALFLALAAGAGLVAGRLTRGLKDASSDDSEATAPPAATQGLGGQWAQPSDEVCRRRGGRQRRDPGPFCPGQRSAAHRR